MELLSTTSFGTKELLCNGAFSANGTGTSYSVNSLFLIRKNDFLLHKWVRNGGGVAQL
jgi:hypothetical protein